MIFTFNLFEKGDYDLEYSDIGYYPEESIPESMDLTDELSQLKCSIVTSEESKMNDLRNKNESECNWHHFFNFYAHFFIIMVFLFLLQRKQTCRTKIDQLAITWTTTIVWCPNLYLLEGKVWRIWYPPVSDLNYGNFIILLHQDPKCINLSFYFTPDEKNKNLSVVSLPCGSGEQIIGEVIKTKKNSYLISIILHKI